MPCKTQRSHQAQTNGSAGDARDDLSSLIRSAPTTAGVYWMKNLRGRILYVGKAVNLRARLHSHRRSAHQLDQPIHRHWQQVRQIEWMCVASESEALALEESLIREHAPRYNVALPRYWFLRLTTGEPFPRFSFTGRMTPQDGTLYFGPYPDWKSMERLFHALLPLYRIRGDESRCSWDGVRSMTRCHYADLGWCSAPCAGEIAPEAYRADAAALADLLQGSQDEIRADLLATARDRLTSLKNGLTELKADLDLTSAAMEEAAENLQFEAAARLRDTALVLKKRLSREKARLKKLEKQQIGIHRAAEATQVVQPDLPDLDIWAIAAAGAPLSFALLPFRKGRAGAALRVAGSPARIRVAVRKHYVSGNAPSLILFTGFERAGDEDGVLPGLAPPLLASLVAALQEVLRESLPADPANPLPTVCCADDDPRWSHARDLARMNAEITLISLSGPRS